MESTYEKKILNRLNNLYPDGVSEKLKKNLIRMQEDAKAEVSIDRTEEKWTEKDIVLITYGDSIKKEEELPLKTLKRFLDKFLKSKISIVHVLPFFPYSSDDGFSVIDFFQVDPELGHWNDIEDISENFQLMVDLVINHISSKSELFQQFLRGEEPGKDFFITCDPEKDYSSVVRPRSLPLLSPYQTADGEKFLWTTFSADQIDLNFKNPEVLIEMLRALLLYMQKGTKIIRLDAIAFLWKELGTNCLHLPQTHEVVKLIRDIMEYVNTSSVLLTETNVPNKENLSYFGDGDEAHMVYQFSLPPLLLYSIFSENTRYLNEWASKEIPDLEGDMTYFNFTASHDGIGVRPLEGLLPDNEFQELVEGVKSMGGLVNTRTKPDGSNSPYELNITYYDAMKCTANGEDKMQKERFLLSQTVMMSMQGVPAFYIHSLFATPNYYEGVERTKHNRTINRRKYNENEVQNILSGNGSQQKIFFELLRRIEIRKQQKPFHPNARQKIIMVSDKLFIIKRSVGEKCLYVIANFSSKSVAFDHSRIQSDNLQGIDLLSGNQCLQGKDIGLLPYQIMWIS